MKQKSRIWTIHGHLIEQVKTFKYLGAVFHASGLRKALIAHTADIGQKLAYTMVIFLRTRGGQFIHSALKLFQTKFLAQLLYGIMLEPTSSFIPLDHVQSKLMNTNLYG